MHGLLLIAKSASTGETVCTDYHVFTLLMLDLVCDESDELCCEDWIEYRGSSNGKDWRVHVRQPVDGDTARPSQKHHRLHDQKALDYANTHGVFVEYTDLTNGEITYAPAVNEVPDGFLASVPVVRRENLELAGALCASDRPLVCRILLSRGEPDVWELASALLEHPGPALRALSAEPVRVKRAA